MREEFARIQNLWERPLGKAFELLICGDKRAVCHHRLHCGTKPYFADERLAKIALDTWLEALPNKGYRVLALCVMPDHVHVVLLSEEGCNVLGDAVGAAKSLSCARAGWGAIRWQAKSRDHVVRSNEDIDNQIRYAINNPVRAELIDHWETWPWTYVYPEYQR